MQKKIIHVLFLIALPIIATTSLVKAQPGSEVTYNEQVAHITPSANPAILGDILWLSANNLIHPILVHQISEVDSNLQAEFAESLALTANDISKGRYKINKKIGDLSSTVELVGETINGFNIVIEFYIRTTSKQLSIEGLVQRTVLTDAYAALGIERNRKSRKAFNIALETAIRDIIDGAEALLISKSEDSQSDSGSDSDSAKE